MNTTNVQPQAVEKAVVASIVQMGPSEANVTRDASFETLDVDSLDLVELAQMAEETWGVEIDAKEMSNIKTVGEAIDFIVARTS